MDKNHIHINDDILLAYILREANDNQIIAIEKWINASEENAKHFQEIEKMWLETLDITPKPISVDVDKAWNNVEKRILSESEARNNKTKNFISYALKIAAVFILFFGIFMIYKSATKPNTLIIATTDNISLDTLSDGSIVSLNKNSQLDFPDKFNKDQRLVELEGEAFFEVAHNSQQTFIIDAGGGYIQVVGTKFNVNTNSDSAYINVFVEEGIVKLFNIKSNSTDTISVILKAGEKGRINKTSGIPKKLKNTEENANDLFWKTNTLEFNSCNISEVIKTLEEKFDVKIEASEKVKNLKLTTTFDDEEIEQIMDIISLTFNLKISKTGEKYKIDVLEK